MTDDTVTKEANSASRERTVGGVGSKRGCDVENVPAMSELVDPYRYDRTEGLRHDRD